MIKKTLLTSLILSSLLSFSQEIVSSISLELKKSDNVFQTINKDKKEITLFIGDKEKVKAIHLDDKMKIVDSISSERPNAKIYPRMIGYTYNNNNTRLFWSSNDYKEIFTELYDFNARKTLTKQHSLALKEEKFIQKFNDQDFFYILTVAKKNSDLKLYIFDKEGDYTVKKINLSSTTFYKTDSTPSNLYDALAESLLPLELSFSVQNINTDNPTSLTDSAKKRKCYFKNNKIIITLDTNVEFTHVIKVDLQDFTASEKKIKTTEIDKDRMYLNSNSFYFENKLYQLKSSSDLFYLTIKDLNGNIIKEHAAKASESIDFKNSEIQLEGGDFGGNRTLKNSSQFIRKVNNLYPGISCYTIDQNTLITYGGVSEAQQSGSQFAMSQFGLIGAFVSIAIYNPAVESFNSYSNRKVVKTEGIFDKDGNHVKGDLQPLAFDKIRAFFEKNSDVSSQTLFKSDAYYLGYYDNKTKEYTFRKFTD